MQTQVVKLDVRENGTMPVYHSTGASGLDIHNAEDTFVLQPNERKIVSTGLYMEIPEGYEFQIRPRSGLAANYGITVVNSPGSIDADYRGEIKVILLNTGNETVIFHQGDRIAQMVLCPVVHCVWDINTPFTETARGGNGFGSSGI